MNQSLVKTPKRSELFDSSRNNEQHDGHVIRGNSATSAVAEKLPSSISNHSISSLGLVPELSASTSNSSLDLLSIATPNRNANDHSKNGSLSYFTPLTQGTSPQLSRSTRSSTLSSRGVRPTKLTISRSQSSGVNPFYNSNFNSLLSPTKSVSSNGSTPLQTPHQTNFSELDSSPFKLNFDSGNENSINGHINTTSRPILFPKSKSYQGMLSNSCDTLIDENQDFLRQFDMETPSAGASAAHQPQNSGFLFDNQDFDCDIFLQAADLTLKMVSQSNPFSHTVNNNNPAFETPMKITRSEGSINLSDYISKSEQSGQSTPQSSLSFFGSSSASIADNSNNNPPQLLPSGMVHSRSQPTNLHYPFAYNSGAPNAMLPNSRSTPQIFEKEENTVSAKAMAAAALLLPEGLDESKLVIKKSKRSRKSSINETLQNDIVQSSAEAVGNQANAGKANQKRHQCPLCGAKFQRPEHVKRHMRSHSSEKPFQCEQPNCGKRFNRSDNLKAHLKKIHKLIP